MAIARAARAKAANAIARADVARWHLYAAQAFAQRSFARFNRMNKANEDEARAAEFSSSEAARVYLAALKTYAVARIDQKKAVDFAESAVCAADSAAFRFGAYNSKTGVNADLPTPKEAT